MITNLSEESFDGKTQDKLRKEVFDYLQRQLIKENIDIRSRAVERTTQFFYGKHLIGIFRISNFYKQGMTFEVSYYFEYNHSIYSYDNQPIYLYYMPEEVVIKAEERNAKYLKKVKENLPLVFGLFRPFNPREKYITSKEEFSRKCFEAIKNKRDKYLQWLEYQSLIYADLKIKVDEK